MTNISIELNLEPSLLTKDSECYARLAAVISNAFQEGFKPESGWDDRRVTYPFKLQGAEVVSPLGENENIPDYDTNVIHAAGTYTYAGDIDGITVYINGYATTLAEAIAFPKRSVANPINHVAQTIARCERPDFIITLMDNDNAGVSDIKGVHNLNCVVKQYSDGFIPSTRKAVIPLYGSYYLMYREAMLKAAIKLRDDCAYAGFIYLVSSYTSADELGQCKQLKEAVKQAIASYLNPLPSKLK